MQVLHLQFVQPLLSLEAARFLHLLLLVHLQDQSCHQESQSQTWYSHIVPPLLFDSFSPSFSHHCTFSLFSLEPLIQSSGFGQPSAFCTPGPSRELFFHLLRYLAQRGVHSHLRERPQHALHRYADGVFACVPSRFSITSHFQSMCCLCLAIMALSFSVVFSLLCLCALRGLTTSALV